MIYFGARYFDEVYFDEIYFSMVQSVPVAVYRLDAHEISSPTERCEMYSGQLIIDFYEEQ